MSDPFVPVSNILKYGQVTFFAYTITTAVAPSVGWYKQTAAADTARFDDLPRQSRLWGAFNVCRDGVAESMDKGTLFSCSTDVGYCA